MRHELAKGRVIETLTDILIDVVGWIEQDEISLTANMALELHIDSDDLSFFLEKVIKHFEIEPTQEEWNHVGTIEQTAELVIKHSKDRVIEEIIGILIDVVGWIERDEISPGKDFLRDMHSVDGDLMVFDTELVRHFGIRPTFEAWYQAGTIEKVANLVIEQLLQADDSAHRPRGSKPIKKPMIPQELPEYLMRSVGCFASWVVALVMAGVLHIYIGLPVVLAVIPMAVWISYTSWIIFRPR